MMDKQIKATAKQIKAAIHRFGTISVFVDDEKKAHVIPGHSPELLAVYSDGIAQAEIESDLNFQQEERS